MGGAAYTAPRPPRPPMPIGSVRMEESKVVVIPNGDGTHCTSQVVGPAFDTPLTTCLKERAKQTRREFTPKPVKDHTATLKVLSKVCWTVVVLSTVGYFIWEMIKWRAM